jgi:recombination protein RecA
MFMPVDNELERFLAAARGPSGSAAAAKVVRLASPDSISTSVAAATWQLATLRGRFVELSARGASATLTAAIDLVIEAQLQSEPVAWIAPAAGTFYPPDVAASGVDLAALVVIRIAPGKDNRLNAIAAARSAERLLRSGAFGLVMLDLGAADLSMQVQGRLVTLAQMHDAAVVCLTDKSTETASLGSLVSLRAEATRTRERDELAVTVRALKDKRRGPGWSQHAKRRAPAGLR